MSILYLLLMLGLIGTGIVQLYIQQKDSVTEDMVSILVMTPEEMSVYEYCNALEILKERFELLAGGEKYSLKEDNGQITVSMPVKVFGEADVETVLKCYVTRPTKLCICAENSNIGIVIGREDIADLEQLQGSIPEVKPEDLGLTVGEDYVYYKICFSEEVRDKVKKVYGTEDVDLRLVQDREEHPLDAFYYFLYPTKEKDGYYFVNKNQRDNFQALVKNNYENEPFSQSFSFRVCYPVEWEKAAKTDVKGENQCDVELLSGNLVTLQYSISEYGEITPGELQDTIQGLKMRLDALDTPYAFGYTKRGENEISIQLSSEKIGEDIVNLLGQSSTFVELSHPYFYLNPYFSSAECVKGEDGYYRLEYQLTDNMSEAVAEMKAAGYMDIYLQYDVFEEIILAKESIERVFENSSEKKACFHNLIGWGFERIDEEHKYLFEFFAACKNGINLPEQYYIRNVWFEGKQAFGIQAVYLQDRVQEIESIVKEICPTADVAHEIYHIKIDMNWGMLEDLSGRAVDMVRQIYQKCGFADGEFDVTINFVNEKRKELTFLFGNDRMEHTMEYHGYYIGQEVAAYAEEFVRLVEEEKPLGPEAVSLGDVWMQDWSFILD